MRTNCQPFIQQSRLVLLFLVCALAGCVSPSSTSIFYLPYTTEVFPPKAADAPIPILGKAPEKKHTIIGRLSFSTDRGWRFLRESILYNARANGADAVILRDTTTEERLAIVTVPPRFNWIPVPGPVYKTRKGGYYRGTQWIPDYRPGYSYPKTWTRTGINAEMIVFEP